jgi:hypothetical protein
MLTPLLLAAALATADPAPATPVVGLGMSFQAGSQAIHGVAWVPAADWRTVELRVFLSEHTSVDFGADWIRLALSRLLTSAPTLPMSVCLHLRAPTDGGWALAAAPGLDLGVGLAAVVVDEELAHRPLVAVSPSAKLGFEHSSAGGHYDYGFFLRGSTGATFAPSGTTRYSRLVLEMTHTWNILGAR